MKEPMIVASRGREVDGRIVQQFEVNRKGLSNALTGVQKDNYVITPDRGGTPRPRVLGGFGERCNNDTQWHYQNRIYDNEVATSVTTDFQPNYVDNEIRVRKLTPKECFRLMGFDDEDFQKASKVNSDSQLYKRAGNSIVVDVLEALFTQLRPYFTKDDTE